jgi:competence protein ComEC
MQVSHTHVNGEKLQGQFQGIGATGFVSGEIKTTEPTTRPAFWVRYATFIQSMRDSID